MKVVNNLRAKYKLMNMARANKGKILWYVVGEYSGNIAENVKGICFLDGIMFDVSFEKTKIGHNIVVTCECNGQKCRGFAKWNGNKSSVLKALGHMTECIKYARRIK